MFGADESDQASLDSPVKGRQSSERVGDAAEVKKPAVPPPSQQPTMLGGSSGGGGGGGGGGHTLSHQQPLSMEAMPLPVNKPTKAGGNSYVAFTRTVTFKRGVLGKGQVLFFVICTA